MNYGTDKQKTNTLLDSDYSAFVTKPLKLDYSSTDFSPTYDNYLTSYNNLQHQDIVTSAPDYQAMFAESKFNPAQMGALEKGKQIGLDGTVDFGTGLGKETPWYRDGDTMQGYSALLGAGVGLADWLQNISAVETQKKGLEQNLKQAKEDSALQKTARSNINKSMFA